MALVFNPQLENSPLDTIRDAIDSGGAAGRLEILDGSSLLAMLPLSLPSFAPESGGTSVANTIMSSAAMLAGAPDSFRFVTSYGAVVFAGAIPDDLDLGAPSVGVGALVSVGAYELTQRDVQAREFASTVPYPYSLPPLDFDSPAAPSALVEPKELKLEPLVGQDFESDGVTLRTATYDGAQVLLDGAPLFSADDVIALDLTFSPADEPSVIYATGAGDVLLEGVNGYLWSPLEKGLESGSPSATFNSVATDGSGTWVAVASSGWASRSIDNGATWTALPQGLNSGAPTGTLNAVEADGGSTWVALTTSGWASRSVDNGVTWTALPRGLDGGFVSKGFNSVATDGAGTWVAVATSGKASRSIDNGATWAALVDGLGSGLTSANLQSVATDGAGTWVAVANSGWASRSLDNGATWTALPQGLNSGSVTAGFREVRASGSTWVAVANAGWASRSIDNGATWTALPQGLNSGSVMENLPALDADATGVWVAASNAGWASRSVDNGATWAALVQGLESGNPGAVFNSAATDGAGTWVAVCSQGWASRSSGTALPLGTGTNPRIHSDRQVAPLTVATYQRGTDVFYRDSSDSFAAENAVDDGTPLEVRTLTGAALGVNDRFQFRGLPVATAPDSTGFGAGSIGPAAGNSIFSRIVLGVIASQKPL